MHRAGNGTSVKTRLTISLGAAEWLIAEANAMPGKIAIGGCPMVVTSGSSPTQRPELFKAVICVGPMADMLLITSSILRAWRSRSTAIQKTRKNFRHLIGVFPIHQVRDRVSYPYDIDCVRGS